MKCLNRYCGVLVVLGLAGCAGNGSRDVVVHSNSAVPSAMKSAAMSGKASESAVIVQKVEGTKVKLGVPFRPLSKTDVYAIKHVDFEREWDVLIGSDPQPNTAIDEVFKATYYLAPNPQIEIVWGWIWIDGNRPNVRSRRARAWSPGTGIIVQDRETITDGVREVVERVVFMNKTWTDNVVTVKVDGDPPHKIYELKRVGDYFELVDGEKVNTGNIEDREDIQKVVDLISDSLVERGLR